MGTIVDRAARRGEVPTGTDAAEASRPWPPSSTTGLLVAAEPPSQATADRASAIAAAGGGTLRAHPRSQ
jgi:hypothetical protein